MSATDGRDGASGAAPDLRVRAARGTIVSAVWLVGLNVLSLARGFVVAAFLATTDYGTWGVLMAVLATVVWLKDVGIGDRFVQQRDDDQEHAFQVFFTLELAVSLVLTAIMGLLIPLYALGLGQDGVLLPGLALALTLPGLALQAPIWVHYREMDYVRQRLLQSVDPVVSFLVTLALAIAGLGVWSLVIGALAGCWLQVAAVLASSPYRLALRRPGGALRDYVSFSWPIVVAGGSGLLIAQGTVIAGEAAVGLAGLGAIALANNVTRYTGQVDKIVTDTLYPAVCRIADRQALLEESFVKSNRLALMWGVPFGVGVTLFSEDLVRYVLGEQWQPAVVLLQALGLVTAVTQVGFNWTAYFRAAGRTLPFARVAAITCAAFLTTSIPLLFLDGLRGLAIGALILAVVQLLCRMHELRQLFPRFRWWRQASRAAAPVLPAVLVVLGVRLALGDDRGGVAAAGELLLYGAVVLAATAWLERDLLREAIGYVRGRRPEAVAA
ncbi:MAG TPA: oligosaccharide flippase family protein [Capillimicrobium sp.]|nr:oligosaccharide flippase family protein [Capillimicrobium sp.]